MKAGSRRSLRMTYSAEAMTGAVVPSWMPFAASLGTIAAHSEPALTARAEPAAPQPILLGGAAFEADAAGALYWPAERMLVVSDLHLEKGTSFAVRGSLLPPYDTHDTLVRLARLVERYAPRRVLALGDNFHDGAGAARMAPAERAMLLSLQQGRDWIWITGNHDPEPTEGIGGVFADTLTIGPLTFRHKAEPGAGVGEVSGHLHPVATVVLRGRGVRRRCFIANAQRMVMPAFGAYAGGLNIRHRAFASLFGGSDFIAHVMGRERVYAVAAMHCAA